MPRNAQTIGDLDIHELGIRKDGTVVFVNTKYSCLAELSQTHSFKAIWKPELHQQARAGGSLPPQRPGDGRRQAEVRHRGVQVRHRRWLARPPHDGGVVIDIETDEIVCEGLSMPHSPRWANGKLWVLNAGTGHLG